MVYSTHNKMKITFDNIKNLPITDHDKILLKSLLEDLEQINNIGDKTLYFNWIDEHTEYSPERTDPCPDYYGMYQIINCNKEDETIGIEMTIEDLDMVMCALYNYIVD